MDSDLGLEKAIENVMKTGPYLMYRAGVYGIVTAVLIVALAGLAAIGAFAGFAVFFILLVVTILIWSVIGIRKFRESLFLQMLQAGHVALLTELIAKGRLPEDDTQFNWARERVERRFKKSSVLHSIASGIDAIHRNINRRLFSVFSVIPLPESDALAKVAEPVSDLSLRYVNDAVLAYTFKNRHDNPFEAAKNGLILYCQCRETLLSQALRLTAYSYVSVGLVAMVLMVPVGVLTFFFDAPAIHVALFSVAIVLGFAQKWIFFDAVAGASMIATFFRLTKTLQPDSDWEASIDATSELFHQLRKRAARHAKRAHRHEPTEPEAGADVPSPA